MKTVLITGDAAVPAPLRAIVERGSTLLVERRATELTGAPRLDADRVVFWGTPDDTALRRVAEQYGKAESAERREVVVFVSAEGDAGGAPAGGLPANELYIWPRDEDRLKMAFLTGA